MNQSQGLVLCLKVSSNYNRKPIIDLECGQSICKECVLELVKIENFKCRT